MQAAEDASALRVALDTLRRRRAAPPHMSSPLDRLAAMLSACARAQPGTATFEMEVIRETLLRRFGALALPPPSPSPAVSLILLGRHYAATAEQVATLAALLPGQRIELVVADPGVDPQIRLLSAYVQNLVVIHAVGDAAAANLAVGATRAPMLALLEAAPRDITCWPASGTAWVGAAGSRCLAQIGRKLPAAPIFDPLVSLTVARADWCGAGGLDPSLEDGGGLDIADLALKLERSGTRLLSCANPEDATPPPDPARHWARMASFRARWGSTGVAA